MWEAFGARALFTASYGGADFGECRQTVDRIGDGMDHDAWHREWTALAMRLGDEGDASATAGHDVSAREAHARAATYHRTAYQPLLTPSRDERLAASSAAEHEALRRAVALWEPAAEWLEIPFERGTLPGVFIRARGAEDGELRPTVLYTDRYSGTVAEMFVSHAPAAVDRGYHVLLYDGPGQGRCLIRDGLILRPDWEAVVAAVVDCALARPDVDPDGLVLAGWGFGGYLAPRAAGREPRLAALVADPGQWDPAAALVDLLPLDEQTRDGFPDIDPALFEPFEATLQDPASDPMLRWRLCDRGRLVHGADTLFAYLTDLARYVLWPVTGGIACPALLTANDGDDSTQSAQRLHDALDPSRRTLLRFTAAEGAGGQCQAEGRRLFHHRVYDWLDETLDRIPAPRSA
jgi:hypothetical protein